MSCLFLFRESLTGSGWMNFLVFRSILIAVSIPVRGKRNPEAQGIAPIFCYRGITSGMSKVQFPGGRKERDSRDNLL